MSRSTELARLAIARHQTTGMPLEESIAAAIRQALGEQAAASDDLAMLPRGMAQAVDLMRTRGALTPSQVAVLRGNTVWAARRLLLRLLAARIVVRRKRGVYALSHDWKRAAGAAVQRLHERRLFGLDHGRNRARNRRGAA